MDHAAALLSRLIARRAASFRLQYGFRFMRQTNVALCRWKELSIINTIENIHGGMSVFEVDGQVNIPTPVNFEYLFIRLQCAAKLLLRIIACAKEAFSAFLGILQKAYFVDITSVYLGLLANIWRLCVELCRSTIKFHNDIALIVNPHLRASAQRTSDIPKLDEWLGTEWTEVDVPTKADRKQKSDNDVFSIDISEFDNAEVSAAIKVRQADRNRDKTINVVSRAVTVPIQRPQSFLKIERKQPQLQMKNLSELNSGSQGASGSTANAKRSSAVHENHDIGEALCRDTLQVKRPKLELQKKPKMEPIVVHRINTMNDLQQFITSEEALRKNRRHKLSKVLNNDEWQRFTLKINDLIATMEPWRAVKRFRSVWYSFINNATNK